MDRLAELKAYRADPSLNYSFLVQVGKNNLKPFKGSPAAMRGSLVDTWLTTPEIFNQLYFITDEERPNGELADILNDTFNEVSNQDTEEIEDFKDLLLYNCKKSNYGGDWTDQTIWKKILKLKNWWILLNLKGDKEIITTKEANYAKKLVNILRTDMPGKIIINSNCKFQVPLFGKVLIENEWINIKGLVDILDVKDKIIITDLKTTGYSDLEKLIDEKDYLIQASMYHELVCQNYPNVDPKNIIFNHLFCQGYKVTLRELLPIDLEAGKHGREKIGDVNIIGDKQIISKKYYPGYLSLIKLYLDCKAAGINHYDFTHHYYEGVSPLKSIYG